MSVCLPVYLFVRRRTVARHLSVLTYEALRLGPCQCTVKYKLTWPAVDFTAAIVLFNAAGTPVTGPPRRVLDNTHFSLSYYGQAHPIGSVVTLNTLTSVLD